MSQQMRPDSGLLDRLLFAAQGGEQASAIELVQVARPWVHRVTRRQCRRFGVGEHDVEDIVQETFARVLDPRYQRYFSYRRRAQPSLRSYGPSHAYLVGHILNSIKFGTRRRRAHLEETLGDITDRDARAPQRQLEAHVLVADLVRDLPSKTREAVVRVYMYEETEREAATSLEISAPTVCRLLRRFRDSAATRLAA